MCQPLCERRPNVRFCKQPIHIRREVPGHVANRLQAALWREALHLVAEGIESVADVDTAISAGPGLRWALMGPYLTFHLALGVGGIDHFLDQFAAPMVNWWQTLGHPTLTSELKERLAAGITAETARPCAASLNWQPGATASSSICWR